MNPITWTVAHTQPLKENIAKQHLQDQGYEVYLPLFKKICKHARKVEEKPSPLFPRYLFVGLDLERARWRNINGTRGVSYLLMANNLKPAILSADIIKDLRLQETEEGIVPLACLASFKKGEKLRILEGTFKDQLAIFKSMDDNTRVQLLLNFIGKDITITLPLYAVEAV